MKPTNTQKSKQNDSAMLLSGAIDRNTDLIITRIRSMKKSKKIASNEEKSKLIRKIIRERSY